MCCTSANAAAGEAWLDPEVVVVGCADLERPGGHPRCVAKLNPNMRVNLRKMAHHYLGFTPPKGSQITLGDWEAQWLSDAQINYAALDALYVGEIFREMRRIHAGY